MKYALFCVSLFLASCVDQPHTTEPVLPEFKDAPDAKKIGEGHVVFQENCASCHNIMKDATGPAVADVIKDRDISWLDTFFNHRTYFRPDSSYHARVKVYESSCPEINLSKSNLEALIAYIRKPVAFSD